MNKIKKILVIFCLCVFIIPQTGCGTTEPVSKEFFCLDTVCTISVYDKTRSEGERIIEEAINLCDDYEKLLSRTLEGSDVYNINNADGQSVEVSDETIGVITKGIEMGEISDGRFDITIGAVSSLWDFKSENAEVPAPDDIEAALKTVDYRQININGNRVTLGIEGAQLDLGGIAKGYIADRLSEFLEDEGVESGIINLGGNVAALGSKEDGSSWKIGIERPYSDRSEIIGVVEISDETVTTSGIYERFFEYRGELYHHVLDPVTGYPADTAYEAVTVEGSLGMSAESDALGTVFLIMGPESAEKILKKYPDFKIAFTDADNKITVLNGMKIQIVE